MGDPGATEEAEDAITVVGGPMRLTIPTLSCPTVSDLYSEVAEATGRLRSCFRLFYAGSCLLDPARSLVELGITSGTTVHAHFRDIPDDVACVLQVWPAHGPEAGGVLVHVYGREFRNTAQLCARFGSTVVAAQFKSAHLVTCIAPPHAPGVVAVEVSSDGAQFTAESKGLFTYIGRRRSLADNVACSVSDSCTSPVHGTASQPAVVGALNTLG